MVPSLTTACSSRGLMSNILRMEGATWVVETRLLYTLPLGTPGPEMIRPTWRSSSLTPRALHTCSAWRRPCCSRRWCRERPGRVVGGRGEGVLTNVWLTPEPCDQALTALVVVAVTRGPRLSLMEIVQLGNSRGAGVDGFVGTAWAHRPVTGLAGFGQDMMHSCETALLRA